MAHWERCIQLSAEPFIWLFSDDDLMPADGVERVMEALSRPHHQRGYFFRFPLAVIDGETSGYVPIVLWKKEVCLVTGCC